MRRPTRRRPLVAAIGLSVLLAACTRDASPEPDPRPPGEEPSPAVALTVAFLRDGSHPDFLSRILPAEQGLRLALQHAALDLGARVVVEPLDLGLAAEDLAAELAALTSDPAVVAAVLGPDAAPAPDVITALEEAGLPVVSLSAAVGRPEGLGAWRRLVPPQRTVWVVLGRFLRGLPVAGEGVCLAGLAETSRRTARTLRRVLPDRLRVRDLGAPEDVPPAVEEEGCGAIVWRGGPGEAAAARRTLVGSGLRGVAFLAGPRVKDPAFLEAAGAAGEGTLVACACADLTLSPRPAARRFIHDYAGSFGSAPGVHAAEGFDAGSLLAGALAEGGPTREGVAAALSAVPVHEGLGGIYRFDARGELVDPMAAVRLYRDEGGRWIPVGGA